MRAAKKVAFIYHSIREELLSGRWRVGDRLPREIEVAAQFKCSVGTANKALSLLAFEGFLVRKARAGTTVIRTAIKTASVDGDPCGFTFFCVGRMPPGIWRIARGFQNGGLAGKYRTMVVSLEEKLLVDDDFMKRYAGFMTGGFAIYIAEHKFYSWMNVYRCFQKLNIPLVVICSTECGWGCPTIGPDDFHAGNAMTNYLIGQGAKRVGFFGSDDLEFFSGRRYQGYKWALESQGLDEPSGGDCLGESNMYDICGSREKLESLAFQYLIKRKDIDAVVCGNEVLALAFIKVAREMGINVPHDLLVGVLDDLDVPATENHRDFVVYRFPFEQVGIEVYNALDSLIRHQVIDHSKTLLRGCILPREGRNLRSGFECQLGD